MIAEFIRCTDDTREALHQAGHLAGRRAVARALHHATPESVTIIKDSCGKPHAHPSGSSRPIEVSISHAFPFAFAAATTCDQALGVDVERIRNFPRTTWEAFLTPAEKVLIARAPLARRNELRTLAWSLKESVLKALGTGLRTHPARVDVSRFILANTSKIRGTILFDGMPVAATAHRRRIDHHFVAVIILLKEAPHARG